MRTVCKWIQCVAVVWVFALPAWSQSSPGRDIGGGAADIGKGPVKGAGSAARGAAKGTGDLVTLHPVSAVGAVGKGAAGAGKDVTVGAVKGTGKIAKGVGKAFGKIF